MAVRMRRAVGVSVRMAVAAVLMLVSCRVVVLVSFVLMVMCVIVAHIITSDPDRQPGDRFLFRLDAFAAGLRLCCGREVRSPPAAAQLENIVYRAILQPHIGDINNVRNQVLKKYKNRIA